MILNGDVSVGVMCSRSLFWCIFILLSYVMADDPVVKLPQGRIFGVQVYVKSSLTPDVEVFYGVPYAASSSGRHRFAAPERHPGWSRTFLAHRMPPRCPQLGISENENFNEDCLFLNIWTPRRADTRLLPVMIILYSESWLQGGVHLPCQELAAEGVVVVTVAYRLHALSFFTLRSIAARGNLALLDQYLAIVWVRENIAEFGGDAAAITLLGHSAGADSVLYHIASPRSTGLFQRAIVMSPRDIWQALGEEISLNATDAERVSREMARSLGCSGPSDQDILHCMRARPLSDILSVFSNSNWSSSMRPVSDDFLPESEYYLPTSLSSALLAAKQPGLQLDLLLGTTDLDAINHSDGLYDDLLKRGAAHVTEYANNKIIPQLLRRFSLHQSEAVNLISQAIRWEYWGLNSRKESRSLAELVEGVARAQAAGSSGAGAALLAARLARRVSRLYVYRYARPGTDLLGRQMNYSGAVHGTDLVTLLGDGLMLEVARRRSTRDERIMSTQFQRYITNFVKYGSPSESDEWRRYRAGDAHVQDLREPSPLSPSSPRSPPRADKDIAFWLQYLPQISNLVTANEHTEQLTQDRGESRLRGGVFALSGVAAALLLLLAACAAALRREWRRRAALGDHDLHN